MGRTPYLNRDDVILGILALNGLTHKYALRYLVRGLGISIAGRELENRMKKLERDRLVDVYCESAVLTKEREAYLRRN